VATTASVKQDIDRNFADGNRDYWETVSSEADPAGFRESGPGKAAGRAYANILGFGA
jgi:hypothetical protein